MRQRLRLFTNARYLALRCLWMSSTAVARGLTSLRLRARSVAKLCRQTGRFTRISAIPNGQPMFRELACIRQNDNEPYCWTWNGIQMDTFGPTTPPCLVVCGALDAKYRPSEQRTRQTNHWLRSDPVPPEPFVLPLERFRFPDPCISTSC